MHEPIEQLTVDTAEENIGGLTEQLASRQAQLTNLENDGAGRVRYAHRSTAGLTFRSTDELIDAVAALRS